MCKSPKTNQVLTQSKLVILFAITVLSSFTQYRNGNICMEIESHCLATKFKYVLWMFETK